MKSTYVIASMEELDGSGFRDNTEALISQITEALSAGDIDVDHINRIEIIDTAGPDAQFQMTIEYETIDDPSVA